MERKKTDRLLRAETPEKNVLVKGWVRTRRDAKGFCFLELNDGSCLKNLQIIAPEQLENFDEVRKITTGSAISVQGEMIPSPGSGQKWELQAEKIQIIDLAPDTYPLQKKRHSDEYLRTIAHLRPRTNKYGAVFRIRSELSFAVHRFFHEKGFRYIHTPILTGSDCEGAGELFRVTALDLDQMDKKPDLSEDFFGVQANLTVSGQLSAEMFALSLGDVYTFGPTFRAENSNTRRHAAEFWMIEPEMAFCDLDGNMDLAEEMIKSLTCDVMKECEEDLGLFTRFVDKTLPSYLENIISTQYERISYTEAMKILSASGVKFDHPVGFGEDLQTEHERFLTETHFRRPVFVFDYPKNIKPFYMRLNDDDLTVGGVDLLVPRIGEIIGGSRREERPDVLRKRMAETGLSEEKYWWYLESRIYGSVPHSGFGLGFERLLMMITGIGNIRDVIPFPRTPKNIEF